jgi:elongation factor Ts
VQHGLRRQERRLHRLREGPRAAHRRLTADEPENIRPKIVEGKLKAWYKDVVLLDQEHVNGDKHDGRSIEQLRAALSAKTGENVVIKRFVRFAVGE